MSTISPDHRDLNKRATEMTGRLTVDEMVGREHECETAHVLMAARLATRYREDSRLCHVLSRFS